MVYGVGVNTHPIACSVPSGPLVGPMVPTGTLEYRLCMLILELGLNNIGNVSNLKRCSYVYN
jgi:hypothetical protein